MDSQKDFSIVDWGIECFTQVTGGIPANDLTVLETPNYQSGRLVLGHFLHFGLQAGESGCLITFDNANVVIENLRLCNMDMHEYLESGQLTVLNFKPNFAFELGLSLNYTPLFEEIERLCGKNMPQRIAIQQVDSLINLHNLVLMNSTAQKLSLAASSEVTKGSTILGQFVQFNDQTHQDLAIAFQKTLPGYVQLKQPHEAEPNYFQLSVKKLPWFSYRQAPLGIHLRRGQVFEVDVESIDEVA